MQKKANKKRNERWTGRVSVLNSAIDTWMSRSSSCTARLRESASTMAPEPDSSARIRMAEKFSGRSSSSRARLTSSPWAVQQRKL